MTRRTVAILTALSILGLAASACGRKTSVRPRELISPQAVEGLAATNTVDGIELRWRRPTRYVGGSHMLDLAGFRIERRRACCGFREIHQLEVEDRERFRRAKTFTFVDTYVEQDEAYLYRVTAYTVDDYRSEPTAPVEVVRELPPPAPEG